MSVYYDEEPPPFGPIFTEEIERLGQFQSEDDIYLDLDARGIRGVPRQPSCCVLARLLGPLLAEFGASPLVDSDGIEVLDSGSRIVWRWRTTETVQQFIEAFDAHEYPSLETPGSKCGELTCERCNPPTAVTPNAD